MNTNNNNNNNNNNQEVSTTTTTTNNAPLPLPSILSTIPSLDPLADPAIADDDELSPNYIPLTDQQEATRGDLIVLFFTKLRERGLTPRFMFTDKDEGQITAIAWIWGAQALAKPKLQDPYYNVDDATAHFDFIDHRFQPDLQDRNGRRCDNVQQREAILTLMQKHYNMHMNIPIEREYYTSDEIYDRCVREMYGFCEAHGLRDAWAYLYERWYREPWFKKWARSAWVAVPVEKTMMMIESQ
ncbi:hypothetical protein INT45_013601 [Circinella minor]|uniref:Uncharacterized protein n=1 Tax=Circinella minor TaxID=1195481 RepID=A0A8H7RRW0_9FUNG|nr:hypothetical protein INT45_013601 [Circinella minor]